jgi:ornithine carbamoyltransferase
MWGGGRIVKRDLVSIFSLDRHEIDYLMERAAGLKAKQRKGVRHTPLKGKTLVMIFEKASTRTRISFEVGMYQLGGYALFLDFKDMQLGRGESVSDTARVLSRYVDGIMARTFSHEAIEELARHAAVPVINGLSDLLHPCQVLSDVFTIIRSLNGRERNRGGRSRWSMILTMPLRKRMSSTLMCGRAWERRMNTATASEISGIIR